MRRDEPGPGGRGVRGPRNEELHRYENDGVGDGSRGGERMRGTGGNRRRRVAARGHAAVQTGAVGGRPPSDAAPVLFRERNRLICTESEGAIDIGKVSEYEVVENHISLRRIWTVSSDGV